MSAGESHKKYQKDLPSVTTKLQEKTQTRERQPRLGLRGFLGVVLVAGALFNVPQLLKKPETDADWMMLIFVAAMLLAGLLLLFLPRKEHEE